MKFYFTKKSPQALQKIFMDCVFQEIFQYPCMGLVSKENNGCHSDMNWQLFIESSQAISHLLESIYLNLVNIKEFVDLQKLGYASEREMFFLTKNINTQKGLIFCGAIYYFCLLKYRPKTLQALNKKIAFFCQELKYSYGSTDSRGDSLYRQYKIRGAKFEAVRGYRIVYKALKYYEGKLKHKAIANNYKIFLLLAYISQKIKDTTLINKVGLEKYKLYQSKIKMKLDSDIENKIDVFNQWCIENNISPGGSADILVLVLFTQKLISRKKEKGI